MAGLATAIVPAGPAYVHLPVSADQVEKIKESTVFHQGGGESVTIGQAMQTAIRHHQAGRLAEAERIYRQILDRQPGHAQALELLGALNLQRGRSDAAVVLIGRALALRPNWPEALSNRGKALRACVKSND